MFNLTSIPWSVAIHRRDCAKIVKDASNVIGSGASSAAPSSTSSSLLAGLKSRDPEAWRRLARLYGPLVYRWCRRVGLQVKDAEDVAQEVFLTVSVRIADFRREREGDTFRGWLWTITRNKLGDWMRRQREREQAAGGRDAQRQLLELPAADSSEPAETGESRRLYQRALDLIHAEFEEITWQAFWRVTVDGHNPADVAGDLGLSRNAIYIAKSRVLRRLREVLGDQS